MPYRLNLKSLTKDDVAYFRNNTGMTKKEVASALANLNRVDRLLATSLTWVKGKD